MTSRLAEFPALERAEYVFKLLHALTYVALISIARDAVEQQIVSTIETIWAVHP